MANPRSLLPMTQPKQQPPVSTTPGTNTKPDDIRLLNANAQAMSLSVNGKKMMFNEADYNRVLGPKAKGTYGSFGSFTDYLKSPGGKAKEALKQEQMALFVAMKKEIAASFYRQELHKKIFQANLRLMKIEKRKAETKEAIAANNKQVQKNLAADRAIIERNKSSSVSYTSSMNDAALENYLMGRYDKALRDLDDELGQKDDELGQKLDEAQRLEDDIIAHLLLGERMEERHGILNDHIAELDAHSQALERLPGQERMRLTRKAMEDLYKLMFELRAQIEVHVHNGEDDQILHLSTHLIGFNMRIEGMQTMLAHSSSKFHYFTEEGQKADAYHNAAFIVPSHQHLHRDEATGQFYLLEAGQKFEDLSVGEKAAAQAKFEQLKPELTSAKVKVKDNNDNELRTFENGRNELLARSDAMQRDLMNLSNEQNSLMSDRASIVAEREEAGLNPANLPAPTPGKTPTPSPQRYSLETRPSPQFSPTQTYIQIMQLMRFNPTQEVIDRFRNSFQLPNGQPHTAAQQAISNSLKPGMPIPPTVIHSLAANLGQLVGVTAIKLNMASPSGKPPQIMEKQKQEEPQSTAPTPFSTSPSPYRR